MGNGNGYSDTEWQARVDLAAAYRLTDHFGMTTLIFNHITSRVPGTDDQFLINEYGIGYNEVKASNLVKINLDGKVLDEGDHRINIPGYIIHSAVHAARHDVNCVMHSHTPYGMAVSALEEGCCLCSRIRTGFTSAWRITSSRGLPSIRTSGSGWLPTWATRMP